MSTHKKYATKRIGARFGTAIVIGHVPLSNLWKMRCDCGAEYEIRADTAKSSGGGCATCSPHRRVKDFNFEAKTLKNASTSALARMAINGSDACLVEIVRRATRRA